MRNDHLSLIVNAKPVGLADGLCGSDRGRTRMSEDFAMSNCVDGGIIRKMREHHLLGMGKK